MLNINVSIIMFYLSNKKCAFVVKEFNNPIFFVKIFICLIKIASASINFYICCCKGFIIFFS